jgi:hypothetical protein
LRVKEAILFDHSKTASIASVYALPANPAITGQCLTWPLPRKCARVMLLSLQVPGFEPSSGRAQRIVVSQTLQ